MAAKGITIRVEYDDNVMTHIPFTGVGYETLCGLDGKDDGQAILETPKGQKIDCDQCIAMWLEAKNFRKTDFEKGQLP